MCTFGRMVAAGLATAAMGLAIAGPARATDEDLRSVSGMVRHNRVLLVFAPGLGDRRLAEQRRVFAHFAPEAAARDLLMVQVADGKVIGAHDEAARLRDRYATPAPRYRTLLLGKDGTIALDRPGPLDEATIRRTIDAMPMRQEEIRQARAGHGRKPE